MRVIDYMPWTVIMPKELAKYDEQNGVESHLFQPTHGLRAETMAPALLPIEGQSSGRVSWSSQNPHAVGTMSHSAPRRSRLRATATKPQQTNAVAHPQ